MEKMYTYWLNQMLHGDFKLVNMYQYCCILYAYKYPLFEPGVNQQSDKLIWPCNGQPGNGTFLWTLKTSQLH